MLTIKEKFLIVFPSYLIAFLPLFLITGPFLSDLSVVLVSLIFLINIIIRKELYLLKNKFFIIFFIFFLYLVFNSFVKFYDVNNLRSSLGYIRFGLFTMGVIYFLDKKPDLLKWLFWVFAFCFVILIFDGFLQYFLKTNYLNVTLEQGRITSLFGSEHILGSYLSRLFPIFLGLTFFLYNKKKNYIFLISFFFILIEVLIFLSGERVAFFFNSLAAVYVILMLKDFKKIRFFSFLASLIIILVISMYDDSAKKRIWDQTINQIGVNSNHLNFFSEGHESHYKSAYKMFEDNKIIGIGIRNFRNYCNEEKYKVEYKKIIIPFLIYHDRSCTTHPHNTYIQLLSETGIIGFSFLLGVFFYFLYLCIIHLFGIIKNKVYYFNNFEICLLAALLITIWPFIPSGNFFNNWLSIIYYFPLGFLLWSVKKNKKNSNK